MAEHGDELNGGSEARREQMVRAALEVIEVRGFADTRIADVAAKAGVSPALVIYYFQSKDSLLTAAMAYAEDAFYELGAKRMAAIETAAGRLEEIVAMTCLPAATAELADSWALWLDLWAQAVRHPEMARVRQAFDERWRETIGAIVRAGQESGEFTPVDVDDFAIGFSALLDGLAVQIALEDRVVNPDRAFSVSMAFAARQLGWKWKPSRARRRDQNARRGTARAGSRPD